MYEYLWFCILIKLPHLTFFSVGCNIHSFIIIFPPVHNCGTVNLQRHWENLVAFPQVMLEGLIYWNSCHSFGLLSISLITFVCVLKRKNILLSFYFIKSKKAQLMGIQIINTISNFIMYDWWIKNKYCC